MRIIKAAVKRVRREVAQVLLIQFPQGANQGKSGTGRLGGKSVRLIFVTARPAVEERGQPETHHPAEQAENEQCRDDVAGGESESGIEPGLVREHREAIKRGERKSG